MKITKTAILFIFIISFHIGLKSQSDTQSLSPTFDLEEKKGQWLSAVYSVDFKEEMSFVGLSAYESIIDTEGYYKYRTSHDGVWSSWVDFSQTIENALLDRRIFEAPPIEKSFEKIQFSSIRNIAFPTIRLFFGYISTKPYFMQSKSSEVDCTCELPEYCDRSCWCPENNCQPLQPPAITEPTHVIVHHSAGFNTSTNFAAVVAYYYDLHVNTNGWDDIGYNWLIDANGVIYEGRGSMAQGAHFSCMNGNTTGICMIGDFTTLSPTIEAITSMENLISWEMCDKNINPLDVELHENSELELPTISGHRDGNISPSPLSCASGTICPGDVLYDMLAVERLNIADYECLDLNTSITENFQDDLYLIYPNPFDDEIRISSNGSSTNKKQMIQIFNIYGKLVFELENFQSTVDNILPVSSLDKGMYLLQISGDSSKEIHRITKN